MILSNVKKPFLGFVAIRSKGRLGHLSLRMRLLVGLVVIAAIGLIGANFVVYGQTNSYLTRQVDQELSDALVPVHHYLEVELGGLFGQQSTADVPAGTYGALLSPNGKVLAHVSALNGVGPSISSSLISQVLATAGSKTIGVRVNVPAQGARNSIEEYRLLALPVTIQSLTGQGRGVEIVAIPLNQLEKTLAHLKALELEVTGAVLVLLGVLGYLVVWLGIRPLKVIETTAQAIAAGDLTRRVERDDSVTEIGRLGASLNAMLTQIENAFAEQRASEQRLRQFLADASHELRTPLTSIRGYAELFRRGASDRPEDLERSMRRIEQEAARMGVLVEDLLLLARLDEGRPLHLTPVDLAAVAADAAIDGEVRGEDHQITFEASSPVFVLGDEVRLRQVAGNLVSNAIVHTPPGTAVHVSVTATAGGARLCVKDDGPGLSSEHAQQVFERFYRADPSRNRYSGGAGLGLAIVASIVEAHGGRASLVTELGQGACFCIDFPPAPPSGVDITGSAPDNGNGDQSRFVSS